MPTTTTTTTTTTTDSPATIQYRLRLPHALHAISPALSALHASRAAALHPEISAALHPSHCPKCGTFRFSGDHQTSLVPPSTRKKRRRASQSRQKSFQRKCHLCGFSVDASPTPALSHFPVLAQLPTDSSKSEAAPTVPRSAETESLVGVHPSAGTVPTAVRTPKPSQRDRPKSGHTTTSTLKDLISRDRQREKAAKANKKDDGLAAFLKEL